MSNEKRYLDCFVSSQVLGDGYLVGNSLVVTHDEKWIDYLEWKRNIAENVGLHPTTVRRWSPNVTNTGVVQQRVAVTMNVAPAEEIPKDPSELIRKLTPLGLLLWWLDDGSLIVHEKRNGVSVSRFGYLGTEAFDEKTNWEMSATLLESFGLSVRVHVDRGSISNKDAIYYRLYLNAIALRRLIDIVRPFLASVPASMRYKLNMDYRPTRIKTSELYSQLYNF